VNSQIIKHASGYSQAKYGQKITVWLNIIPLLKNVWIIDYRQLLTAIHRLISSFLNKGASGALNY